MILNPILTGGRNVKKVVLSPTYAVVTKLVEPWNSGAGNKTATLTITYDAEKQKSTFITILQNLGNNNNYPYATFSILPNEPKVIWNSDDDDFVVSCKLTKDSDSQYTLTLEHTGSINTDKASWKVLAYEM